MQKLLAALVIGLLVVPAMAQVKKHKMPVSYTTTTQTASSSSGPVNYTNTNEHYLHAGLGFANGGGVSGLFAIGAEYERMMMDDFGVGGILRYYNTSDDQSGVKYSISMVTLGGFGRIHIPHRYWDFYFSPGFGVSFPKTEVAGTASDSKLVFTPMLAIGGMFSLNDKFAIGVENLKIIALGSDYNGTLMDDWMVKGRMSF